MKKNIFLLLLTLIVGCKEEKRAQIPLGLKPEITTIKYAKGFSIEKGDSGISIIKISSPWPNAETAFTYALVPREKLASITLNKDEYDAIVTVPVEKIVVTSTTHIPALEALGVEDKLLGFPSTDFISSIKTRKRIDAGLVKELGNNESINTEVLIDINPDVVIGFGINNKNKAYEALKRSFIPVVYNGDWTEETPLGKAEWLKFFAPFFQKEKEADSIFSSIESSYNEARLLARDTEKKPDVLTGGLYKDVWYVAGGKSWMAQFLRDANTNYLWKETEDTGSISLSFESVLSKAQQAEFWLNPSLHVTYEEMTAANRHYKQFRAYQNRKVFTNASAKGATGGLLFYELASNRPDIVLRDLIHLFHPGLLPNHEPYFFKPLE
ncbi:MAG: ABC transporter substrate-binding protein [Flavobacteriaceae bacterium]